MYDDGLNLCLPQSSSPLSPFKMSGSATGLVVHLCSHDSLGIVLVTQTYKMATRFYAHLGVVTMRVVYNISAAVLSITSEWRAATAAADAVYNYTICDCLIVIFTERCRHAGRIARRLGVRTGYEDITIGVNLCPVVRGPLHLRSAIMPRFR